MLQPCSVEVGRKDLTLNQQLLNAEMHFCFIMITITIKASLSGDKKVYYIIFKVSVSLLASHTPQSRKHPNGL